GWDGHVGRVHVKGQGFVVPAHGRGGIEGIPLQVAGAKIRLGIGDKESGSGESAADPHRAATLGDGRVLDITGGGKLGNGVGSGRAATGDAGAGDKRLRPRGRLVGLLRGGPRSGGGRGGDRGHRHGGGNQCLRPR